VFCWEAVAAGGVLSVEGGAASPKEPQAHRSAAEAVAMKTRRLFAMMTGLE
jgi:hypothetical protein